MILTIQRLGHLGEGIAPGPVYAPTTLPGEVVEGEVVGGRMLAPKIVTPSQIRVKPPCPHFKSCGACSLQHASDEFVSEWKADVVRKAVSAQGLSAEITGIHTSPPYSRRRATLSARRSKKGAIVGFHARASDTIIEIPNCHLLHPDLMATLPVLAELTVAGGSRKGEIAYTITRSSAGIDVLAIGGKPLDGPLRVALAGLVEQHALSRLTWEGEQVAERQPPLQRFGAAHVLPPPGAFLQATAEGEAALLQAVQHAIGPAKHIADLFAGCGTFALPLSEKAEVHAVEGEAAMLAALDRGWRHAIGLKRITTETRDLFRRPLLPDELKRFDAVVIDPPRAGAEAQITELAASTVNRIAAVSCNPVTFARDARILVAAGFVLTGIEVVDQFRWSPHVELVAGFAR
ncbi:MAG: class I SAM-dependent RNA methyltransferase [Paracoccaceae bacterium]